MSKTTDEVIKWFCTPDKEMWGSCVYCGALENYFTSDCIHCPKCGKDRRDYYKKFAVTIGATKPYDKSLATPEEQPVKKIGARPDEGYGGGWVWRNVYEAAMFLEDPGFSDLCTRLRLGCTKPEQFSIYVLELPNSWEEDVSKEPDPSDGVHRLLNDAIIKRKFEKTT